MTVLVVDDDILNLVPENNPEADNEIQVVGTGNSGQEAVNLYSALKPDVCC